MAISRVGKALGRRYPDTPEELVSWVQRVLGPMLDELRTRFNQLPYLIGINVEDTEADLAALDTTNFKDGCLGVSSDTRNLYSLDLTGVAAGADLSATPTGRWKFIQAL